MRGELNGLEALILQECPCPYGYNVHCLAHQNQPDGLLRHQEKCIISIRSTLSTFDFLNQSMWLFPLPSVTTSYENHKSSFPFPLSLLTLQESSSSTILSYQNSGLTP